MWPATYKGRTSPGENRLDRPPPPIHALSGHISSRSRWHKGRWRLEIERRHTSSGPIKPEPCHTASVQRHDGTAVDHSETGEPRVRKRDVPRKSVVRSPASPRKKPNSNGVKDTAYCLGNRHTEYVSFVTRGMANSLFPPPHKKKIVDTLTFS